MSKTKKEELLEYVAALTPEQVDKVLARLDLFKKCLAMEDYQATYTNAFTGKMFFGE